MNKVISSATAAAASDTATTFTNTMSIPVTTTTTTTIYTINTNNNTSTSNNTIIISEDTNLNVFTATSDDEFIVLPGPDDILIYNSSDGVYQHSVTLTARMWPPIEATPDNSSIWGLPTIFWGILTGFLIITIISLVTIFLCCWLLPRKRKFLSPTRFCTTSPVAGRETIMAHRASVVAKPWGGDSGHMVIPMSIGLVPPQYSAPPPPPPQVRLHSTNNLNNNNNNSNNNNNNATHQYQQSKQPQQHQYQHHHQQQQQQQQQQLQQQQLQQQQQQQQQQYQHQFQQRRIEYPMNPQSYNGGNNGIVIRAIDSSTPYTESRYAIPETHKSMWAINPLYASNTVLYESDAAYKSRSLPSWGKSKQRPISTADDLDELYAKVNFSKKRRNRMRNGEAAIIALCRSRSQNLQGLALERDGVVIYDERTAL